MSLISATRTLAAAAVTTLLLLINIPDALAGDFTARVVMEKMSAEQRYSFLAGVVEGLAYARYASDNKETTGMKCVYDWFYSDPKVTDLIYAAFEKYPDYTPGAVVAALAKRKCN